MEAREIAKIARMEEQIKTIDCKVDDLKLANEKSNQSIMEALEKIDAKFDKQINHLDKQMTTKVLAVEERWNDKLCDLDDKKASKWVEIAMSRLAWIVILVVFTAILALAGFKN